MKRSILRLKFTFEFFLPALWTDESQNLYYSEFVSKFTFEFYFKSFVSSRFQLVPFSHVIPRSSVVYASQIHYLLHSMFQNQQLQTKMDSNLHPRHY